MPETLLTKNLVARINYCIERAECAGDLKHHGLAGQVREIFLADLIKPLLLDGFRAGTGKIINSKGELSPQTDVVIYNKARFSPLMFDESSGVFPVESVLYAIEVKTTVNNEEISDAIEKAEAIHQLGGNVRCVLFGFKSNVTTPESDLSRFTSSQPESQDVHLGIYCCVGNGYCYFDYGVRKWQVKTPIDKRAEVIGFLIGLINTQTTFRDTDTSVWPGSYLAWWTE